MGVSMNIFYEEPINLLIPLTYITPLSRMVNLIPQILDVSKHYQQHHKETFSNF